MTSSSPELLTIEDFELLQNNKQPESRESIARKIGAHFAHAVAESVEHHIASEIAFYLQKDDETIVRAALAESVYDSETAPKQLILLLAMDDDDTVAIPVLKHSPQIIDEDLVELLPKIEKPSRLVAVAERKFLSVTVTTMLVERDIEDVVVSVLANDSAIVDDEVILHIAYKHANSKPIFSRMMKRMPVPTAAVNHMVKMQQSSNQVLPKATEIKSFSSLEKDELKDDVLTLMFLGREPSVEACEHMLRQLEAKGKVSATLMLLAMCLGHEQFFITYMADNTKLPRERVEELCGVGEQEFSMLMNKSGISPSLYPLMFHIYKGMRQNLKQGNPQGTQEFAEAMIECLIETETKGINFATTIGKPLAKALKETFA